MKPVNGEKRDLRPHRQLDVWNKAMSLVKEIYLVTEKFPRPEMYGLTSQMRRASVSIPSNLAEGQPVKVSKNSSNPSIAQG